MYVSRDFGIIDMVNWNKLTDGDSPDEISERSHTHPVMIFKHSTRCGISFSALDKLTVHWDNTKVDGIIPYILDVVHLREYAREVGSYFGIPHQSPQVLLIKDGKCVYKQSHFGINFGELEDMMSKLNGSELR